MQHVSVLQCCIAHTWCVCVCALVTVTMQSSEQTAHFHQWVMKSDIVYVASSVYGAACSTVSSSFVACKR